MLNISTGSMLQLTYKCITCDYNFELTDDGFACMYYMFTWKEKEEMKY